MPHLSILNRTRVLFIYLDLTNVRNKFEVCQRLAIELFDIKISKLGIQNLIHKWRRFGSVQDRSRPNLHKQLITDEELLAINKLLLQNSFYTCRKIKAKLNLVASDRSIREYINKIGWRKVNAKYCQIVSPTFRVKRFIYACFCKTYTTVYKTHFL